MGANIRDGLRISRPPGLPGATGNESGASVLPNTSAVRGWAARKTALGLCIGIALYLPYGSFVCKMAC